MARAVPWLGLGLRLTAATIWLFAGAAKLGELARFRAQVDAFDLPPGMLTTLFAYTLPFVEVGLGLYLLVGLFVRPVAILSSVLMLVFIGAMAQAWARGLSLDCGCFGTLAHERVGLGSVLRDAALGLPGLGLAFRPARLLSLDHAWLHLQDRFYLRSRARKAGPPAIAVRAIRAALRLDWM